MDYLPLAFNLREARVLLVGAGVVAARKATLLKKAGASLHVVALTVSDACRALLDDTDTISERAVVAADLEGVRLIIAATDDRELHVWLAESARARQIPINVVDTPELCDFIFPAIIDRNPILIGISSSGKSPVLARLLRKRLEAWLPRQYGQLGVFMGSLRDKVSGVLKTENQRRLYYETLVESAAAEAVLQGDLTGGERLAEQLLTASAGKEQGDVALVGAGPGVPDLLTFKALRLIQRADVILYDRLVSPDIIELARRDAERIYVGKERKEHSVPQESINETLARLALDGLKVVRLKGGDPFIFGRGGEELTLLADQGIPFQVVPGITSASGAASYAGIPLTHRDYAQSVRFIPGYLKEGSPVADLSDCVRPDETLVIYMGLKALSSVVARLLDAGRAASTPIALIENATLSNQMVVTGTLSDIEARSEAREWHGPTLIIVGEVIKLHQRLSWFHKPSLTPIT